MKEKYEEEEEMNKDRGRVVRRMWKKCTWNDMQYENKKPNNFK